MSFERARLQSCRKDAKLAAALATEGLPSSLKRPRPGLLPRDDIRRVLLMPRNSEIKLRPLRIRQRRRIRFQALPDRIQQFRLLRSGQAINLASQIAHTPTTLARFLCSVKRSMRTHFQRALEFTECRRHRVESVFWKGFLFHHFDDSSLSLLSSCLEHRHSLPVESIASAPVN